MSIRGYIDIAIAILVLLLLIVILWFWKAKDNAQADLIAAQATHAVDTQIHKDDQATLTAMQKANDKLAAFRSADDRLIADFVSKLSEIDRNASTLTNSLSELRHTNADVEKYLATPIPVPLANLLNGVCDSASCANAVVKQP